MLRPCPLAICALFGNIFGTWLTSSILVNFIYTHARTHAHLHACSWIWQMIRSKNYCTLQQNETPATGSCLARLPCRPPPLPSLRNLPHVWGTFNTQLPRLQLIRNAVGQNANELHFAFAFGFCYFWVFRFFAEHFTLICTECKWEGGREQ